MTEPTVWTGCYNGGWQGVLTPEAFCHPAKVSRGLAKRIYQHALERGWLKETDVVLDPFGGIAGFAFHALQHGLTWIGIELEQKFVDLGQQNIALWNTRYSRMPRWGTAQLLQGDSRRLSEVVREAGCCISSPPYSGSRIEPGNVGNEMMRDRWGKGRLDNPNKAGYGSHPAQLGNMREGDFDCAISSPPYAALDTKGGRAGGIQAGARHRGGVPPSENAAQSSGIGYGASPGQLAAMPTGDVDAVVSSPPYVSSIAQSEAANDAPARKERKRQAGIDVDKAVNVGGPNSVLNQAQSYGISPGQLAAMPTGEPVDACISSPPFEQQQSGGGLALPEAKHLDGHKFGNNHGYQQQGSSKGQLSLASGDTFWQAARTITEQVFQVLKPGGMAFFVLKAFVRNKAIVDFPDQWQRMAESCGFETVEIIHALLTEDRGAQYALDGELHKKTIKRASFFRRLHERKYPHLAIDYEVVLCQQKPL